MANLIEGVRNPKRLAAEKRAAAVQAARAKHQAKAFATLSQPVRDELLLMLLQAAGIANENGVLLPPE